MDNRTVALAEGVWLVEVAMLTNALVVAHHGRSDSQGLTVVDTGPRAGGPRLVRSVRMLGLDPRAVRDVLLTHWHTDHSGSAARFASSSAAPRVWSAPEDLAVVRGSALPAVSPALPGPLARASARWGRPRAAVPAARGIGEHPDGVATDDGVVELPDVAGGLRVVPAPGHTAGHVAVHLPARGVLHAGDALVNVGGLRQSPRVLSADPDVNPETLLRLAELDFSVLSVGHGRPLLEGRRSDARFRLRALADAAAR